LATSLAGAALAGSILAGCGGPGTPSTSPADFSTLVGAGRAAFRQGDYNAASQLFEQALAKSPDDPTAHYDLGSVYQAENLDKQALTEYAKALAKDPTFVPAIYNEATIYAAHDVPLAIFLYRKVIHIQPNSPTAYLNLGLLEDQQGQHAQAGADLRQAVALDATLHNQIPPNVVADLALPPPPRPKLPPAPGTTTSGP
jgi:tetratricopeptide (TPR) repeat protein